MNEVVKAERFEIVVDRIEGEFAVCEFPDMSMKDIKIADIPFHVREKTVINVKMNTTGDLEFISIKKPNKRRRIHTRFVRFS